MYIYVINLKRVVKLSKFIAVLLIITSMIRIGVGIIGSSQDGAEASADIKEVIVIDAGHGGEDSGAIGANGSYEKNLNLDIAMLIGEELKARGYTVVYTRTEDKMLYLPEENVKGMRKISDLKNRCKIANQYDKCILLSIHMNSFGASKYSGLQVYYKSGSEDSRLLANKIQTAVREELQPNNKRQIKSGESLYLLENTDATAVLIECGFLTNEEECEKLSQKEYQKRLSFSIICGIIEYINENDGV